MASHNYTPLFGSILTSTVWAEDNETRLVWITMLAMSDAAGYVGASIPGLAHAARVSLEGCEKALKTFLGPDPYSRTRANEGRKISEARGGWTILNYGQHAELAAELRHNILAALRMRKTRARRRQQVADVPEQVQHVADVPPTDTDTDTDADVDTKIKNPLSTEGSSEPVGTPASEPLIVFPVVGKGSKTWGFDEANLAELRDAYPSLDVLAEARKALAWVQANPSKRKTAKGMKSFLCGWMGRTQNRGINKPETPEERAARLFRK